MKAISLWQPWATLIAIGAKTFETRGWHANYAGPVAIHAAKKDGMLSADGEKACAEFFKRAALPLDLRKIPHGAIIAVCYIAACYETDPKNGWTEGDGFARLAYGPTIEFPERYFGDYSPNRFAWKLEDVRPLLKPIPFPGRKSGSTYPTNY